MAPRYISKKQTEQAPTGEDGESELENLDPKAISKDMEKNVGRAKIEVNVHHGNLNVTSHLLY
jgi:hypothetical protein